MALSDENNSLQTWISGPPGLAIVTAPGGSGLTTFIKQTLVTLGIHGVWITPAMQRVSSFLPEASSSSRGADGHRKLIVIDECDVIAEDATLYPDLVAFIKQKSHHVHVICAGRPTKKINALGPKDCFRCTLQLDLSSIEHTENVDKGMARTGDIRQARLVKEFGFSKDIDDDGMDLVRYALTHSVDIAECLRMFSADTSVVPMGIFENYLTMPTADLETVAAISDGFSRAGVIEKAMYSKQQWELFDAYGVHTVGVTGVRMKPHAAKLKIDKFGTLWSRMYNQSARSKHVKLISTARAEAGMTPLRTPDLAFVRHMLLTSLARNDSEQVVTLCRSAGLSPKEVLGLMRLWATPSYKQSVHVKVKRWLAADEPDDPDSE